MTKNFFTSFFIEIKKSTSFLNFRDNFIRSLSSNHKNQFSKFSPHISLTYGNFSQKDKNKKKMIWIL